MPSLVVEVVAAVGVECEYDVASVGARLGDSRGDAGCELLRAREPERAVDEVVLVIDYYKQFFHVANLLPVFMVANILSYCVFFAIA